MALPASDTFTGANNALETYSSNWIIQFVAMRVASNHVQSNASALDSFAYWNPATDTFTAHQYAQLVIEPLDGSYIGPAVRVATNTDNSCYGYYSGSGARYFFKYVGGVYTQFGAASSSPAPASGDVLRIQAVSTTITALRNGSADTGVAGGSGIVTDSALAAGQPGVCGYHNGATYGDNWEADDLPGPPPWTGPTYQALGTSQASQAVPSNPAWPAHLADDIGLLIIESCGGEAATLTTASGFAAVLNSPSATGTTTSGTRITAFWCRATSSSMASPALADPGNHVYAVIITFRGCVTSGNPWDTTAASVHATAVTTTTWPTVTTSVANCLIVHIAARDTDSAAAAWGASATNAALTDIAKRQDEGTALGNGGGTCVFTGNKAAAGAVGTTTAAVASSINAMLTIALKSAVTGFTGTVTSSASAASAAVGTAQPIFSGTATSIATADSASTGTRQALFSGTATSTATADSASTGTRQALFSGTAASVAVATTAATAIELFIGNATSLGVASDAGTGSSGTIHLGTGSSTATASSTTGTALEVFSGTVVATASANSSSIVIERFTGTGGSIVAASTTAAGTETFIGNITSLATATSNIASLHVLSGTATSVATANSSIIASERFIGTILATAVADSAAVAAEIFSGAASSTATANSTGGGSALLAITGTATSIAFANSNATGAGIANFSGAAASTAAAQSISTGLEIFSATITSLVSLPGSSLTGSEVFIGTASSTGVASSAATASQAISGTAASIATAATTAIASEVFIGNASSSAVAGTSSSTGLQRTVGTLTSTATANSTSTGSEFFLSTGITSAGQANSSAVASEIFIGNITSTASAMSTGTGAGIDTFFGTVASTATAATASAALEIFTGPATSFIEAGSSADGSLLNSGVIQSAATADSISTGIYIPIPAVIGAITSTAAVPSTAAIGSTYEAISGYAQSTAYANTAGHAPIPVGKPHELQAHCILSLLPVPLCSVIVTDDVDSKYALSRKNIKKAA